ncbi:hypothetical protein [Ottowia thiooxydans]|uniref:hypothetical protein n=1 Tax=Ottowia thiooxydans TaxID=219182 RepID=UPI0003F70A02|nr:hypothetical protein [Ottowia thiooxydans]
MKSQSRRRASDPVPAFIAAAAVLLWLAMIAKAPELRLPLWRFGWLLAWCAAITIGWAKVLAHADPREDLTAYCFLKAGTSAWFYAALLWLAVQPAITHWARGGAVFWASGTFTLLVFLTLTVTGVFFGVRARERDNA